MNTQQLSAAIGFDKDIVGMVFTDKYNRSFVVTGINLMATRMPIQYRMDGAAKGVAIGVKSFIRDIINNHTFKKDYKNI